MSAELTVVADSSVSLIEAIIQAAKDPNVDAAKVNALLDIKIKIEAIDAENKFWAALKSCQDDMEPIRKDAVNPENHSRYAKVSTVQRIIQPIYRRHGFGLSFTAEQHANSSIVVLVCTVSHIDGHRQRYQMEGAIDDKGPKGGGTKTSIQGTVSTSSYLRRKLYELIFDLILTDDDDDGNLGKGRRVVTQEQADNIYRLLDACDMTSGNRQPFYAWAKVKKAEEILECNYAGCVAKLQAKARKP